VKSVTSEAGHRVDAKVEQERRQGAGDELTPSRKAGSLFNQAKDTVQADMEAMKRDGRNDASP
jgi:hypothetical protein